MRNRILKHAAAAMTLVLALVLALAMAACGGGSKNSSTPVTDVTLAPSSMTLGVGGHGTLTATVLPPEASNKEVTWTSSDPTTASIAGAGAVVTINGLKQGNATITVTTTDGGHTKTCPVIVTPPVAVSGVSIAPGSLNLVAGTSATLTATVSPSEATNKDVTWATSAPTVASVTGTGATVTINALNGGNAVITATSIADPTKNGVCTVQVTSAPVAVTDITVAPTTLTLTVGGAAGSLTATVNPPGATNKNVTWNANPTGVVNIVGSGATVTVNPVAPGNTTITVASAADPTKTATCQVGVSPAANVPVSGVTVAPTTLSLTVGGAAGSLTATVNPPGATDKNVTWSISPTGVATLSATTGATVTVTPVAQGNATITVASAADPTKSATCAVGVAPPATVTKLTLPKNIAVKSAGGQAKLTVDITPWNAGNRNITWTTSNSAIATVTGTGAVATVTGGNTLGTARITATSAGSPTISDYCDVAVGASLFQEVFIGGNFGMYKNDVAESAYSGTPIYSVTADAAGVVHAVGYHNENGIYHPTYYRDGVRTHLPMSNGMDEGIGMAVHVTPDNHVYVAGYEANDSQISAKLWVDGVSSPLAGASEFVFVQATGVCVSGGNVYVSGIQSADGQSYSPPCLWINGVKTTFNAVGGLGAHTVVALGPDVYVGGGFGVIKLNPATPTAYTVIPGYSTDHEWGSEVLELRLVGEDIYAAGWAGADPVQWKNHVATVLEWPDPTDDYGEAHGISVAQDGTVHAAGHSMWSFWGYSFYTPGWWVNGSLRPVSSLASGSGNATRTVFVKESVAIPVTSVSVVPATLNVPVGYTGSLTATVLPASASNKNLTWTSSNEAVASVTGTGPTVTINGVSLGGPVTITARSVDNNAAFATCTVNVVTVNVASVSLPPTLTVGRNRTARLTATVTPPEATNKAATWSTSNPGIATVTGTDLVGTVTGVALGNATITITTQDGNRTASCLVTVADIVDPVMYVAGDFGLYVDGEFDTAINGEDLSDVVVDSAGVVHAAGWYYDTAAEPHWKAAYYKDGVRTMLPYASADYIEAGGNGIDVPTPGQVYIAGYEIGAGEERLARLWLNGVAQTLQGTSGTYTYAYKVLARNGHVYVAGGSYDDNGTWCGTIWLDGVKHRFDDISLRIFTHMAIDSAGAVYVTAGTANVWKFTADLSSHQEVQLNGEFSALLNLCTDGTDLYVVGWEGNEGYCWKNGARSMLPEPDTPDGAYWYEANAVFVHNGDVYIAGRSEDYYDYIYWISFWKNGEIIPFDDDVSITDYFDDMDEAIPYSLFLK